MFAVPWLGLWCFGARPFARALIRLGLSLRTNSASSASGWANFAATPFVYRGQRYASIEGFWQMMFYPEGPADPRALSPAVHWSYTRQQVAQMTAFEAKHAGFRQGTIENFEESLRIFLRAQFGQR